MKLVLIRVDNLFLNQKFLNSSILLRVERVHFFQSTESDVVSGMVNDWKNFSDSPFSVNAIEASVQVFI